MSIYQPPVRSEQFPSPYLSRLKSYWAEIQNLSNLLLPILQVYFWMMLLKMGPKVPSRAPPALCRSEKEGRCRPPEPSNLYFAMVLSSYYVKNGLTKYSNTFCKYYCSIGRKIICLLGMYFIYQLETHHNILDCFLLYDINI